VVTLRTAADAIPAVHAGTIDATIRALTVPERRLPEGLRAVRVFNEPLQLLTGPAHEFATAVAVTPKELVGHRIWMPGVVAGTEWGEYYDELAATFGITIDSSGPNFGSEHMLEMIADSAALATLVGEQTQLRWPTQHGLRRIPLRDPTPAYPHSLIWRADNPHPALAALRAHLTSRPPEAHDRTLWTPDWATNGK